MKRSKYISLLFLPALIGCTNRCVMSDYHDIPDNSLIKLCVRDTYPYDIIPCDDLPRVSPSANEFQDQFGYTYHPIGSSAHQEALGRTKAQAKPKIETEMSSIHYEAKNYIKAKKVSPVQDSDLLVHHKVNDSKVKDGSSSYYSSSSTQGSNTIDHHNSAGHQSNTSLRGGLGSRAEASSSSSSSSFTTRPILSSGS